MLTQGYIPRGRRSLRVTLKSAYILSVDFFLKKRYVILVKHKFIAIIKKHVTQAHLKYSLKPLILALLLKHERFT